MLVNSAARDLDLTSMAVSILEEKKTIIRNITTAIVVTGFGLNIVTIIRDAHIGISLTNSMLNSAAVLLLAGVLIFRKRLSLEAQTLTMLATCLALGIKLIVINGIAGGTFYFFVISSIIALLILPRTTAIWIIATASATYLTLITLFAFDVLIPKIRVFELHIKLRWLIEVFSYVFVLFVVIGGIGRLQRVLINTIDELNETNQKLNQSNEELLNQVEQLRAMQKKVDQTELNFKRIFEESNDGIILCDSEGLIMECNNSICAMIDYPKSYLLGHKASDFVTADDKRIIDQLAIEKVNGAKIRDLHIVSKSGGRIPVEVNYSPFIMGEHTALLVTIRDVRERKQMEQQVLNAVIQAEENERSRFAEDLHDDLGPILSSIKMYIQYLRTQEDSEDKKDLINRLLYTVDDSIKSIRRISYNLSSHLLQNMGLINALVTHADRINLANTLTISITHNFPEGYRLASNVEIVTYRVLLELITNSIRHSQGTKITIDLTLQVDQLIINYSDDGIGFDIDRMLHDNSKGIGLKNILSRIKSVKGHLNFETHKPGFNMAIEISL